METAKKIEEQTTEEPKKIVYTVIMLQKMGKELYVMDTKLMSTEELALFINGGAVKINRDAKCERLISVIMN